MATNGESKGDDFRHTCGLCMESYRDRQPKLLPCFHTFCLPCLTTLAASAAIAPRGDSDNTPDSACQMKEGEVSQTVEKASNNNDQGGNGISDGRDGDSVKPAVFLCPTCRSPVRVPQEGVARLQTNFYLDCEETNASPRPVPCDMCQEGQSQDATHACDKCQKRMCRACRRLHDIVADPQLHKVRPLGPQEQPIQQPKAEIQKCLLHPDQNLVMHCRKCDVTICLVCKFTSHEGHETEDVTVAAKKAKEELADLRTKIAEQMQVVGALLDRLARDEGELVRQEEEAMSDASKRYDTVTLWARHARGELFDNMASKEQAFRRDLQAQMKSAQIIMETFSDLEKRSFQASRSNPDIVSLKSEFQSALLTDEVLEEYRKRAAGESSQNRQLFPVQSVKSAVEPDLMRAYIGQLCEADQDAPSISPIGLFQNLAHRVHETATRVADLTASKRDLEARLNEITAEIAELTSGSAYVTSQLKDVARKASNTADAVAELNADNKKTQKEITVLKTDVATLNSQVPAAVKALKKDLEKLKSTIQKSAKHVTFHALLTESKMETDASATLIFEEVMSNEGGCYDRKTGVFTAPYSGTYVFFVTVRSADPEEKALIRLMVENQEYARTLGTNESAGSAHICIKLATGRRVSVQIYRGKCDWWETTFSGALVQAEIKL